MYHNYENKENFDLYSDTALRSPKRKAQGYNGGDRMQNITSNKSVTFNLQDFCQLTEEIKESKSRYEELSNKTFVLKKRLANQEKEKEALQRQVNDLQSNNEQLIEELRKEKEKNSQINNKFVNLERKYQKLCRQFPSNVMLSVGLYYTLIKEDLKRKTVEGENGNIQSQLKISQENCGLLMTQKSELQIKMDQLKLEEQKKIDHLEFLNSSLQQKLGAQDDLCNSLSEQIEQLKQRYFYSCALALKLNAHALGQKVNVDIHTLYEQAIQQQIPFSNWDQFITKHMFSS